MARVFQYLTLVACLATLATCGEAPRVMQGTVVSYDSAAMTLVVEDEREPGRETTFSLAHAEFSGAPFPGQLLRLSYRAHGENLEAVRVMNLVVRPSS